VNKFILTKWHIVLLLEVMPKNPTKFARPKKSVQVHFKVSSIEKENIARHACLEDKNISSVIREAFFKVHPDLKEKVNVR
jgi:hypothetical protein